jgi:hypothetical protein
MAQKGEERTRKVQIKLKVHKLCERCRKDAKGAGKAKGAEMMRKVQKCRESFRNGTKDAEMVQKVLKRRERERKPEEVAKKVYR